MSKEVTLQLPDTVLEQAEAVAARTQRRTEDILSDWLDHFVAGLPIDALTDEQVLALCDMQMDEEQQAELSDLLSLQREGQLDIHTRQRLHELMNIYRRGLVRKAEALKVAVERRLRPPLSG